MTPTVAITITGIALALFAGLIIYRLLLRKRAKVLAEDLLKKIASEGGNTPIQPSSFPEHSASQFQRAISFAKKQGWLQQVNGVLIATKAGLEHGKSIVRTHRIIETYLAERTGYPPYEWHKRAEKLEHKLHSKANELMLDLGCPVVDPNGDPIPSPQGKCPNLGYLPATQAGDGYYRIAAINDRNEELYTTLALHHFHKGTPVHLTHTPEGICLQSVSNKITIAKQWQQDIQLLPSPHPSNANTVTTLWELTPGEKAIIIGPDSSLIGMRRRRLSDLGFVKGGEVSVYMDSPLQNPKAYLIRDTAIALRKEQAQHILIRKITPCPQS